MIVRVVEVGSGESLNIHIQLTAVIVSFPVHMREEGREWWSMRRPAAACSEQVLWVISELHTKGCFVIVDSASLNLDGYYSCCAY